VTVKELSKYLATVAPTRDLPTPVGAHKIIFLYPDFNLVSISVRIDFWRSLGEKVFGKYSKRDRINLNVLSIKILKKWKK